MSNPLKIVGQRQAIGYFTGADWPTADDYNKPVNYVMRGDGVWEVRVAKSHLLFKRLVNGKLLGFTDDEPEDHFTLRHGKVPGALLHEIVAFFKYICDKSQDEAYIQTFWDPDKKEYYNFCPSQRVTGASVNYMRNTKLEAEHELMLETHSHNTMNAFFSGTDDKDEKNDRFYGVVGQLDKEEAEMQFSFVHGGKRELIHDIHKIFEEDEDKLFPKGWNKRTYSNNYGSNYSGGSSWSGYTGHYGGQNKTKATNPNLVAESKGPGRTVYRHKEQDRIDTEVKSAVKNARRVLPRFPATDEQPEESSGKKKEGNKTKKKPQVNIRRKGKRGKGKSKGRHFLDEFLGRLGGMND